MTDPTSGFRMTDRRGIELFARDYPHDYPEIEAILLMHAHRLQQLRDPGGDAPATSGSSAISSTQSVYYMVKVLLAVFVGLFRAPTCRRRSSRADRVAEPTAGGAHDMILVAIQATAAPQREPARRGDRRGRGDLRADLRAGQAQAPDGALRDPVAGGRSDRARALARGRAC